MVARKLSSLSISSLSSAGSGTGARAAGASSCPRSHLEHFVIAEVTALQSSRVFAFTDDVRQFDARRTFEDQPVVKNPFRPAGFLHLDFDVPESKA